MTENELIQQIKQLRQIKPRQEWASLLKSQITNSKLQINSKFSFWGIQNFQKRLAYSLAALALVVVGLVGFGLNTAPGSTFFQAGKIEQKSVAALSEQKALSKLAETLQKGAIKNPKTLEKISASLKTLANITGASLDTEKGVKDLYQTIVENQIADFEKTTLTDTQKQVLTEIKDLYNQEKYTEALEKLLSI